MKNPKRLLYTVSLAALGLSLVTSASAADWYWNDNSPTLGSWAGVSNNWSSTPTGTSSGKPGAADNAHLIKTGVNYTLTDVLTSPTVTNIDFVGSGSNTASLIMTAHTLTASTGTNISGSSTSSLRLTSGNFNLGAINISGSALALLNNNKIDTSNTLTFSGLGQLLMGGNTQTFNNITVTVPYASGSIDMGSGSGTLSFTNGDFNTIGSTLYIAGWTGTNTVKFESGTSGNFSPTGIRINGMQTQFDATTKIVTPLPEPSTYAAIVGGLVLVGTLVIRRKQKSAAA